MIQNNFGKPLAKNVGIWIRVSTEDQAHGESPEHHEQRARYYAASKNWSVCDVYHLEAVSGKSVLEHPEAKRMLGDVAKGRISGLIFSKLARLARNTRELLDLADIFREHDADLISLQESIDTSTPAGRLFYTMLAAMAQWEREEIADRVAASVPIRAKLGKPLGGQAPFGYKWEDRELVPDEKEAPVRRLMYELFLQHKRKKTVARLLTEAGHRTRNGSKFTDTTIDRLIRDPMAKGLRRANYTKSLGDKKHWVLKPESEWVTSEVEPVVSEELWNECNAMLDGNKNGRKPPARKAINLFAGFAFCACGEKMYVPTNTHKYTCSKCRNKIPVGDLEHVFQEQLKQFYLSPADFLSHLTEADHMISEKRQRVDGLERDRNKIKHEMDKIMQLYLSDKISADGFASEYKPLEDRLRQVTDEIPKLQGEIDFLKIQHMSSGEILAEAKDLSARWPALDISAKRQIIENITERVVIGSDDVTIDLCYMPSAFEITTKRQHNVTDSSRPPA